MLRATIVYAIAAAVMGIYGGRVCPYIEGLGLVGACGLFAACFAVGLLARWALTRRWLAGAIPADRARVSFYCDSVVFLGMALAVAAVEFFAFAFPVTSGLKMGMGFATLWLFGSLDLALAEERQVVERAVQTAGEGDEAASTLELRDASSLGRQMMLFAAAAITLAFVDVILVVNHALGWLADQPAAEGAPAHRAVLAEVGFVGAVLLGLIIAIIAGYARNVSLLLRCELAALDSVQRGEFKRHVPVVTRDEFGLIAAGTNRVIRELGRNHEARSLLGKVVGGRIAEEMLAQVRDERGLALGGTRRRLVILIADIRDFTPRCESHAPEQVVGDLNCYFSHVVPIVESEGGIVDKFIGDGLMAVFGLDDEAGAADRAVRCAQQMLATVPTLSGSVREPIQIGIGVACGDVLVGNIGSQQRLEFTAIGTPVNLAARLEALTKKLVVDIAVHECVLAELTDKRGWRSCGYCDIKGKSDMVEVFGWSTGARYRAPTAVERDFLEPG